MTGPLELAFEIISTSIKESGLSIVGVYEAPLVTKSDSTVSPLTFLIAETIRN